MFVWMESVDFAQKLEYKARSFYNSYGNSSKWKNFQGNSMPIWEDLPEIIQTHWIAVAKFAVSQGMPL